MRITVGKKGWMFLWAICLLSVFFVGCQKKQEAGGSSDIDYYTCSMHPSVKSKNPTDKCPICSMDLIPVKKKSAAPAPAPSAASPSADPGSSDIAYYTCSMHPSVKAKNPKDKCPICSMDLIPVKKSASSPSSSSTQNAPDGITTKSDAETTSVFEIAPQRLQAIGVTFETVSRKMMDREIRAPGVAVIDESSVRDINVKTADGFVEKLYANYEGKFINKGQPLMTILSEGWIQAQMDYIRAYRALRRTPATMMNYNSFALENKVEELRRRIRVWDLSEAQIRQLEGFALNISEFDLRTGKGLKGTFDLLSPISGHVHEKKVAEGAHFDAGQTLLMLVDLSHIWINADFPEDQASFVGVDQEFEVSFPSLPTHVFKGKVSFLNPHLMEETRRITARIVLENPHHKLRPGMYANVVGKIPLGEKLAVSSSAVIPTGDRYVVFLDHGEGKLEPRFIQVGQTMSDSYEVVSGLSEGDRIVASANFLVDAESRIQGALKTWGEGK